MKTSNDKENDEENVEMGASKLARKTGLRMCAFVVSLWLAGAGANGAWAKSPTSVC